MCRSRRRRSRGSMPDAYRAEQFSFTSRGRRAGARRVLQSRRAAKDRRPAVIFLHGTGSRKEEFLALMRTFADRGFATAAIDARHHGARIAAKYGSGNAQYFAAMLETYRTGKGRPYLYDTVWDVMRLVDYLADARRRRSEAHRRDGYLEGRHRGVSRGRGRSAHRRRGADHRRAGIPVGARQQSVAGARQHVFAAGRGRRA